MRKIGIVKFLIAIALICIKNNTMCDGAYTRHKMKLVNFVCRPEHWQEMWFEKVKAETQWVEKCDLPNPDVINRAIQKFNVIPCMMVCGYGSKFYNFFRLMAHTVKECKSFQQKFVADDCWRKLNNSLETLVLTTLSLLRALELLHSVDRAINLSALYGRLYGIQLLIKSKGFNWEITPVVEYLENLLNTDCKPELPVFDLEELETKYKNLRTVIMNRYDFYVNTLDSYTDYIDKHLSKLGFKYDAETDVTVFTIPNPSE
ncbi:uncharacterized protein LOC126835934 isoform X1 [Adelges cooleyi]|uniref:uncharacterized protein LOC126835934 isoform X1 n=1 Tax=Adelges cooleyi TaxID=133065 RepID=UPI002180268D|nr:uncharacterized protein LOC126835934 isoform X1 [Adelges cooleyi]